MLFVTYSFFFFLLIVVTVRWALPERGVAPFLLAASYFFYLSWNPVYGFLLGGATLFTYLLGLLMERYPVRSKWLLAVGVTGCLGLLAYFKYADFLLNQAWSLMGLVGVTPPKVVVDIILPLGISFYLFQTISYLVDVYRGDRAEGSLIHYALYVSFFPQLVAGPIVRASELIPQFRQKKAFDGDQCSRGIYLLLSGFLKKAVLADTLALWSDAVFNNPAQGDTLGVWVAVLCYTGQIYCDFSGYTDIARGCAKVLGYEIPVNFELPYLSRSPAEFWRRWHMTLSRWLRDYLYIPLGGNRKGRVRTPVNLMITMLLGGLWHGASWNFVIWGAYHGLLLILHKGWRRVSSSFAPVARVRERLPYQGLAMVSTLFAVSMGWVFFRAGSVSDAVTLFEKMFSFHPTGAEEEGMWKSLQALAVLALWHGLSGWKLTDRLYPRLPAVVRGLLWAAMAVLVYLFAQSAEAFIYFQF